MGLLSHWVRFFISSTDQGTDTRNWHQVIEKLLEAGKDASAQVGKIVDSYIMRFSQKSRLDSNWSMDQSVSSASHIYVDTLLVCTDPMTLILLAVIIRCTLGIMATRCRVFSACSLSTVLASCTLESPALGNIALDSCSLTTVRSAGLACFLHLAAPGLALLLKPHFVLDPRILDVLPSALEYTESVRNSILKVLLLFLSEC